MTKYLFTFLITAVYTLPLTAQLKPAHNLSFPALAKRWDEAMPLGNGVTGALIWEKNGRLRFSLDRVDLWDEREALHLDKYSYKWVEQQVLNKQYDTVQRALDEPYEASAYPTKLPGAAIEFDISSFGGVQSNVLDLAMALNIVKFRNGTEMATHVYATQPAGRFIFSNITDKAWEPQLLIPNYNTGASGTTGNSVDGLGLERLGYEKGTVTKTPGRIIYHQPISEGKYYEVMVWWEHLPGNKVIGKWTISNNKPAIDMLRNETATWATHTAWWSDFWKRSAISIPDTLLEKQYYREMYKLGAVAGPGAPAISLQAVWTADNGNLPPWKGDFHNDLNTQLSYWPAYTGNHLQEAATFTDWLWKTHTANRKMTKQYFGVEGLNVPGVETLNGYPMGGWIQYSLSPTTGAWVSQHFYWQWKYSMDDKLLEEKVYPYIHETATFLENITRLENGKRKLPLSSSPEYHDNSIKAWYLNWTNYDLSLAHFLFKAAAEVSTAAGKPSEAQHWKKVLKQLPALDTNETGLTVAPGENLGSSHRHFSPYMAIYPLALLDDQAIIKNSLRHIEKLGTRAWVGYSFTWMASLYARANEADSAVKQLQIFASNFCSPNSFHLNGDQKNGQYSSFTYRPFTLEGNFAFAQGIHELLLRTKDGVIEVFPAVPETWKDISFKGLRAEGAFIVDAEKKNGMVKVTIRSEKNNVLKIRLPGGMAQHKMSAGQVKVFDFKND